MLKEMHEVIRLLDAVESSQAHNMAVAIATVVRVRGSAYRRAGTKMLIDAAGNQVCMISGGCLEQEVGEVAQQVMQTRQPQVKAFDLDEDVVWGLGLGCGGSVDVYVEPFDEGAANAAFLAALRAQEAACLATVVAVDGLGEGPSIGARLFIGEKNQLGSLGSSELDQTLSQLAQEKMAQLYPSAETQTYSLPAGGGADIFLDISMPPPELVIFGAGHDAIPLAQDARRLGFRVTCGGCAARFCHGRTFSARSKSYSHPSVWLR